MLQENNLSGPLSEVQQNVGILSQLSQNLMGVMDNQIMALIADDDEEIEKNAEQYASLKGTFKEKEHEFIKGLKGLLEDTEHEEVRLENLKEIYPDSTKIIESWKAELEGRLRELKNKHLRLNVLLDFAMNRNVQIFQSIYGLSNHKNTRYGSGGNKEDVSSGLAINTKA